MLKLSQDNYTTVSEASNIITSEQADKMKIYFADIEGIDNDEVNGEYFDSFIGKTILEYCNENIDFEYEEFLHVMTCLYPEVYIIEY